MPFKEAMLTWWSSCEKYDSGELDSAIELLQKVADDPDLPKARILYNLGYLYMMKGELAEAIQGFVTSLEKDCHHALCFYQLGVALCKNNRHREAVLKFQAAAKNMRGNEFIDYKQLGLRHKLCMCEVLYNLATAHDTCGDHQRAAECLTTAVNNRKLMVRTVGKTGCCTGEYLQQGLDTLKSGAGLTLREVVVENGAIFRPSKTHLPTSKDFLAESKEKRKVLASMEDTRHNRSLPFRAVDQLIQLPKSTFYTSHILMSASETDLPAATQRDTRRATRRHGSEETLVDRGAATGATTGADISVRGAAPSRAGGVKGPRQRSRLVVAKYDYTGQAAEDLSFTAGEIIEVVTDVNADWYEGRLRSCKGLVPKSFCEQYSRNE